MLLLLFDIDGTLINSGGAGGTALLNAFRHQFGVDNPTRVPFSGRTDRAIASSLFEAHNIDDSKENWERLRATYLELLVDEMPRHEGSVLGGVTALLDHFRDKSDVTVGLLTGNVRHGARIKLEHFGLFDRFPFGGFGDDHRDRDDVARAALAAAHTHWNNGYRTRNVWVIGDTPFDIRCARAIGAKALAVATGVHPSEELSGERPDRLCEDLSDTDDLLALFFDE